MCSSHAGIGGAKRGRVPSAAQDGGIGDRDMVVNNHARARHRCCTALATTFDTIAPSIAELTAATARRSLGRQHRTHTAFPSSRGTCPTPPGNFAGQTRSPDGRGLRRPRTLLWSRGPIKKLIVVLAACARQVGEADGRKAQRLRVAGTHTVTCAAAPAGE